MEKKLYSSDMIFRGWRANVEDEGPSRFAADEWKGHVDALVAMFIKHNIEYDSAKTFERQVIDCLTTEEGRKGKGRYKAWVPSIKKRFGDKLAQYYLPDDFADNLPEPPISSSEPSTENYSLVYRDPNDLVKDWLTARYGYSDALYGEARRAGTMLNKEFCSDVLNTTYL